MGVRLRRDMYQMSGVVTLRRPPSFIFYRLPPLRRYLQGLPGPLAVNLLELDQLPTRAIRRFAKLPCASTCRKHQRSTLEGFLAMTCCAYETTGIAGPLVRYLPPQKLSPPLTPPEQQFARRQNIPVTSLIVPVAVESAKIIPEPTS